MRTALWQWGEDLKAYLEEGVLCKGLDKYSEDWEYAPVPGGAGAHPVFRRVRPEAATRCPPKPW